MTPRFLFLAALALLPLGAEAQTISGGSSRTILSFGNPQTAVPSNTTATICSGGGGSLAFPPTTCVTTVPFNVTLRNLSAVADLPQGAGQTAIVTVVTAPNAGGAFTDSALTCTMSNAQACSDTAHSVTLLPGQVYAAKATLSATATGATYGIAIEANPQ